MTDKQLRITAAPPALGAAVLLPCGEDPLELVVGCVELEIGLSLDDACPSVVVVVVETAEGDGEVSVIKLVGTTSVPVDTVAVDATPGVLLVSVRPVTDDKTALLAVCVVSAENPVIATAPEDALATPSRDVVVAIELTEVSAMLFVASPPDTVASKGAELFEGTASRSEEVNGCGVDADVAADPATLAATTLS